MHSIGAEFLGQWEYGRGSYDMMYYVSAQVNTQLNNLEPKAWRKYTKS